MGRDPQTDLRYVVDVIRGRWSPAEVEHMIKATARWDGEETRTDYRGPRIPGVRALKRPLSTCDWRRSIFAGSDWTSATNGAVLSSILRRLKRLEILPRRLDRRDGASVVRR
jgi:hypothetical protein